MIEFIRELYRISVNVYIVYTKNMRPTFSQILNTTWHKKEELQELLSEANLELIKINESEKEIIYHLSDSRRWFSGSVIDPD